tara:strand:+ start:1305 stop:2006 length:702 start_codon:yes stop_codon:yes gene_type:complete
MNKLTENLIKKAEILGKQYKIYDGNGMFLLVHPNGSKYWRMKYTFDGKSKLASFGVWPKVSLKEARERRHEAKEKIKIGINPVVEKRNIKQSKIIQSNEKTISEALRGTVSNNVSHRFLSLHSPEGEIRQTGVLLKLLRSSVFDNAGKKSVSWFDKEELTEMWGNIYRNRRDLFQIIWNIYLSIPVINIAVLFVLLLILMDFFPALFTTILYFLLTVCSTVAYGFWEETKLEE